MTNNICDLVQGYDPELFSKALPCLSAIGCALSPDYSISNQDDGYYDRCVAEASWTYDPAPVDISTYVSYLLTSVRIARQ